MPTRWIRQWAAGTRIVVLGSVFALAGGCAATPSSADPDVVAVRVAAERAIRDMFAVGILPPGVAPDPSSPGPPIDPAVFATLRADAQRELAAAFAEPARSQLTEPILASIDAERDGTGSLIVDGGASEFDYREIRIAGERAKVTVRAHAFVESTDEVGLRRARPEGVDEFALVLVRLDGRWLVAEQDVTCVSGCP
jgi:hypothetical protein